jgi:predicted component of viral defense system (DUF524 family)
MASPHTGSHKKPVDLLRIETGLFILYIQGKPYHPTVESLKLHRNADQSWVESHFKPRALSNSLGKIEIKMYSAEHPELIPWEEGDLCPPLFYETQSYELLIEKKNSDYNLSFYHDNINLRDAVLPKGKHNLIGNLNFQNEVGFTELELRQDGVPIFRLELEIFPVKMDYKTDYLRILNEVNDQIYNLAFDFLRKTFQLSGLKETQHQSLTEFYSILQRVFHQMVGAVDRIQHAPHYKLQKENKLVDSARVKRAGKENIAFLSKRPHLMVQDQLNGLIPIGHARMTPTHVLESRRRVEYDTLENRFIRWTLIRIHQKLKSIRAVLSRKERLVDSILIKRIDRMQSDLSRLLKLDFLQVGEMRQMTVTLVLQMAPGYREVYRYYLMLMKGLSLQSDLYRLSMKDVAQLYEYWCFIKIHHLLSQKYELVKQDLIRVNRSGLFVMLDQSKKAKLVYRNPNNNEVFTLYYNTLPEGDRSKTISQRPDNVLTLRKQDAAVEYKYIFDAKYRLNPAYEGTNYRDFYKTPGPQEDDINTMHRYRDAIVYESGSSKEVERSMFGAYVLFPYPNEAEFGEHHFYKSIELVNVGALPFLPGATSLMEQFLDEIIQDSPEKAYERSARPRGTKEYYSDKLAGKTVLVGALQHEEQIEQVFLSDTYRIPLSMIKDHKHLSRLEVVAIYQSAKDFGRDRAGIHRYGKIKEWEVVQGSKLGILPTEDETDDELYVTFTVEKWIPLFRPIVPGGHGISSILFTSKYILDRANEVAELRLDTEEQLIDWREKRRQGKISVKWDHEFVDQATQFGGIDVIVQDNQIILL